jgi:hypothetical protein
LKSLFAVLRSFDANAFEIFRKFEMFAYDFIDRVSPSFPATKIHHMREIHRGRLYFQPKGGVQTPPSRQIGNRSFTMTVFGPQKTAA